MIEASPAVGLSRADIAAIRATSDRWVTAVRAGRWADAAATFTADAILRFSGAVYEGRAAIQRFHEAMPPWDKTVLHIDEIDGRGDMAFVAGHSTMVPAGGGAPVVVGRYLDIRLKQADGTWLLALLGLLSVATSPAQLFGQAPSMRDRKLPGLSVAVARGSQVVLAKAYGVANVEHDVPAGDRTIYRIGSLSKQFTAAAILRLVDRQLLNHSSGMRNMTAVPAFGPTTRLDLTDADVLALFQNEPPDFAAGTNFLYTNSPFYLLAMVLERVTGRSYSEHLQADLFGPLGLADTLVCDDDRILPRRAQGYTLGEDGRTRNAAFLSMRTPKGGGNVCSSARDLVAWTDALASGKVMSADSYRLMTLPGTLRVGRRIAYGFGLFVAERGGRVELSHGGDIPGFTAFMATYPEDRLTVATLTNSDAAAMFDGHVAREIVSAISGAVPRSTEAPVDQVPWDSIVGT